MNKKVTRVICIVLAAILCLSLLAGLIPASAATATTVNYKYGNASGFTNVIYNWGQRGYDATFLSPNAVKFYNDNGVTYEDLAALSGSSTVSSVPSSALYKELQELMASNHSKETSYDDTKPLYRFTDCMSNGAHAELGDKISSFYSGTGVGPAWDSGSTWNREHTWPNSKGDASGNGENDIIMLRPTHKNENGSRGNKAYGESGDYYDPNSVSGGLYNLHGDVARIMLYVYVRWGNTGSMWGSSGVIQSKDVLLKWAAEDPVDTWEMGRNDSVESITGTRNVFVDYPELIFQLFGEEVPADLATPSNGQGTATGPVAPPAVVVPDMITAPQAGTAYKLFMNKTSDNKVLFFNGLTESETITYRLATTEDATEAVEVFLEEADGGYRLYFMNGDVKTYIRVYERTDGEAGKGKGSLELVTEAPAEVLTYDTTANTLVYSPDADNSYYLGTYSTYTTFSVSNTSYITGANASTVDVSQFPARFADASFTGEGEGTTEPTVPDVTVPDVTVPSTGKTDLDIVMEAYGLAAGAEMPYEVTITGTITKVNTAYDASYQNVTVTMVVPSGEDMPVKCYRLAGEGADQIGVGDVITVTGTIVNYVHPSGNTEVEFKQGCQLISWEDNGPTEPSVPSTPGTDSFTKINSLSELTSGQYVMIVSTGYAPGVVDGTWITAVQPTVSGDTVTNAQGGIWTLTVNGTSASLQDSNGVYIAPKGGNYNGLKTNDYNWDVVFENGGFKFMGTGADTVALASNAAAEYGNKFRGYKTTTIADAETYPSTFTLYKAGGTVVDPSEPTEPTVPTVPDVETVVPEIVTAPKAGTAYKLIMNKTSDNKVLYFNGLTESETVTYRLATTEDATEAINVYLEEANGGYRLYFMNGDVKTYIRIYERTDGEAGMGKGSLELVTEAPAEVLTYDTTANTLVYAPDADNSYYLGTYAAYTTFSVSNTSYITGENAATVDVSQFPARFAIVTQKPTEPSEPTEPTVPSEPTEPDVETVVTEIVTAPKAGTAYKLIMNKTSDNKVLYFNGQTESETVTYRLATTEDATEAINVFLEEADGGYRLYFMNGDVKTYIRIYERTDGEAGMGKGSLELVTEAPAEVLTYDTTVNTLVYAPDADNSYYLGTYAAYTTFSVSNTSYITGDNAANVDVSQFPARFAIVTQKPTETAKDGWVNENGKWYYYENGTMVKNQWRKDSVGWVYIGSDGYMLTNSWCTDSQGWCYVGADGYAVTNCWKQDSIGWIWLDAEGSMTKNQWIQDGGKWYWLNANGYRVTNQWQQDSKGWVYIGSDGYMLTNAWCTDTQGWCYVGADGYAVTNCWKQDSTGWIWLDANGSMAKNQWIQDGGNWYYLDANGYMMTNNTLYYGGKIYYFNASGICVNP